MGGVGRISPSTIGDLGKTGYAEDESGRGFNRMRSIPIQPSDSTTNPQSATVKDIAPLIVGQPSIDR